MTNPDPHAALREHLAELRLAQIADICGAPRCSPVLLQ
jgi:hypothetical protein